MFLIIAREGNGWAFFLNAYDSVQPLEGFLDLFYVVVPIGECS